MNADIKPDLILPLTGLGESHTDLPCGCSLSIDATGKIAGFTFCPAHRKVKIFTQAPNWPATVAAAIASVARCMAEFTTDDVWSELESDAAGSGDPRALGQAMVRAEKDGVCAKTDDQITSKRKECHGRPVRVWKSLVCRNAGGR